MQETANAFPCLSLPSSTLLQPLVPAVPFLNCKHVAHLVTLHALRTGVWP